MRRRLWTPDGRAVALLVAVPLVAFVVPALFGHPAIVGDNLLQNFPLRVLSGKMIRSGHLPLWNQYIWSGSPLLAGLNAGSLYPGTFAFAFLPAVAAWVVNLLAAYWAGGLGLYALLRQFRLRPLPCLLAAATYAFSGAMVGQMVHLPIVQGMGWIPFMILAQVRLAWSVLGTGPAGERAPVGDPAPPGGTAPDRSSPWRWAALLAGSIGLIFLTGEPRGIAEAEVVSVVVALWLILRRYDGAVPLSRKLAYVGWSVVGAVWAVCLGLVQLLPGWNFINASQRANEAYSFFGSGSLHPQWTVLLLVPDLFGGAGLLHQPVYFNSYNLPEVTGYVGLLPLVAVCALAMRTFGSRRDPRSADWGLWMLLAALGLLMAWGTSTPLGHVFWLIPLFGKTRLQSRNLGIVDLAVAAMFGYWLDAVLVSRAGRAAHATRGAHGAPQSAGAPAAPQSAGAGEVVDVGSPGWRRWVVAGPALAAALCCAVAIALPGPLESLFNSGGSGGERLGRELTPWMVAQFVVAMAVAGLVLGRRRVSATAWRRGLIAVAVLDLTLFSLSAETGFVPGHPTFEPTAAQAAAVLGTSGRFAIYDTTALHVQQLSRIGQPDLNALSTLPSVQGYGSIVGNAYGAATNAHNLDSLDPCALARGVFSPLRLATVLSLAKYLAPPVVPGVPVSPQVPTDGRSSSRCPGAPRPGTATSRTLFLGQLLDVASVHVAQPSSVRAPTGAAPRIGVVGVSGRTTFPASIVTPSGNGWTARFTSPQPAVGVVVARSNLVVSDTSTVDTVGPTAVYSFEGVLQDAMGQSAWRYHGLWQGFMRFDAVKVRPPVWLEGGSASGAHAHLVSTALDGSTVVDVSSPSPVVVVRSEAFLQGWRATATPVGGGPVRTLTVGPRGLVQSVRVPAGHYLVTFTFRAKNLTVGMGASVAALVAFAALGVVALLRRRRRRRSAGEPVESAPIVMGDRVPT